MYLDRRAEGKQDGNAPHADQMLPATLALPSGGGSVDACWVLGVLVLHSVYAVWREDMDTGKRKQESLGSLGGLELWHEEPPTSGAPGRAFPLKFS